MTSKYDLRGRKAILTFWGLSDWQAVLRKRKAGAPIKQEPDGTWIASSEDLDAWSTGDHLRDPSQSFAILHSQEA